MRDTRCHQYSMLDFWIRIRGPTPKTRNDTIALGGASKARSIAIADASILAIRTCLVLNGNDGYRNCESHVHYDSECPCAPGVTCLRAALMTQYGLAL